MRTTCIVFEVDQAFTVKYIYSSLSFMNSNDFEVDLIEALVYKTKFCLDDMDMSSSDVWCSMMLNKEKIWFVNFRSEYRKLWNGTTKLRSVLSVWKSKRLWCSNGTRIKQYVLVQLMVEVR
jgi:hypothetical protein